MEGFLAPSKRLKFEVPVPHLPEKSILCCFLNAVDSGYVGLWSGGDSLLCVPDLLPPPPHSPQKSSASTVSCEPFERGWKLNSYITSGKLSFRVRYHLSFSSSSYAIFLNINSKYKLYCVMCYGRPDDFPCGFEKCSGFSELKILLKKHKEKMISNK